MVADSIYRHQLAELAVKSIAQALDTVVTFFPPDQKQLLAAAKMQRDSLGTTQDQELEDAKNCRDALTGFGVAGTAVATGAGAIEGGAVVMAPTPEVIAAAAISHVLSRAICEDALLKKIFEDMPKSFAKAAEELPNSVGSAVSNITKDAGRAVEKAGDNLSARKIEKRFLRPLGDFAQGASEDLITKPAAKILKTAEKIIKGVKLPKW